MPPHESRRARWVIYLALLLLRFFGVTQRGYVHPDEFYQGGSELFFGRHQQRPNGGHEGGAADEYLAKSVPWEFEPAHALRSIVPPALMTLLPLRVYVTARDMMGWVSGTPPAAPPTCADPAEASESRQKADVGSRESSLSFLWTPAMDTLSGREVWLVPRLFMALLSIIFLDGSLWMMLGFNRLSRRIPNQSKNPTSNANPAETQSCPAFGQLLRDASQHGPPTEAFVLASSWPCLVFGVRPFTNNLEAMVLAFLLVTVNIKTSSTQWIMGGDVPSLLLIGATCSIGIFVRFTFAFFAFPIMLIFLWHRFKLLGYKLGCLARDVIWMALSFLAISSAFILVDTQYYSQQAKLACGDDSGAETQTRLLSNTLKYIAPFNALRYNSKSTNLAEHGLHPRITHAVVNMPMLFGPLALAWSGSIACGARRSKEHCNPRHSVSRITCQGAILSGLLVLSCAPHQEPRFLLPAVVPLVFLCGQTAVEGGGSGNQKSRKVILFLRLVWVVFNAILYAFFAWFHQGGILQSLLALPENEAMVHLPSAVVFYKTYMPPTFLARATPSERQGDVCTAGDAAGAILDLQGADSSVLLDVLRRQIPCPGPDDGNLSDGVDDRFLRLVSPPTVIIPLAEDCNESSGAIRWEEYSLRLTRDHRVHVSTEDWPAFDGSVTEFLGQLKLDEYKVSCAQ